jgi:3-isopropylmalate dehydrogenase
LDLYANLRPGIPYLAQYSPLKRPEFDILLVREAVGGLYFSPERGRADEGGVTVAWDTMRYDAGQIRRIAKVAFELAARRRGKLTSVDKANVLEASKLWREIFVEESANYPAVSLEHLYVDNCAMQLLIAPDRFDVLVTENLFGDILSDEIAGMIGSLGLLPSGSLRDDRFGLYEPVHGSAPDISGRGVANPAAAILSTALLLRHSLEKEAEAQVVEQAVLNVLRSGVRTPDLAGEQPAVSTSGFGDAVIGEIELRFGKCFAREG